MFEEGSGEKRAANKMYRRQEFAELAGVNLHFSSLERRQEWRRGKQKCLRHVAVRQAVAEQLWRTHSCDALVRAVSALLRTLFVDS